MKLTWLGHSGFRLEIGDQLLLIDPWLDGNPMFPEERRAEAIAGATGILLSHGHGDHSGSTLSIAQELNIPVYGIYDLLSWWGETEEIEAVGFNKGGTVTAGNVSITMVNAVHSSSLGGENGPVYAGAEAGFMIRGEGRCIYFSGDTDVTADMGIWNELYAPDIGILCAGGWFTMDMAAAAYAARTFFNFKTVIPCHYKTFPILAQSAEDLITGLPGVDVREPEVMVAMDL